MDIASAVDIAAVGDNTAMVAEDTSLVVTVATGRRTFRISSDNHSLHADATLERVGQRSAVGIVLNMKTRQSVAT